MNESIDEQKDILTEYWTPMSHLNFIFAFPLHGNQFLNCISLVIGQSFFSFQNNPKDLDPSCKTDLDFWDCLGMGKIGIIARFHRTDLVI